MPISLYLIVILGLGFIVKHDPIKFLIVKEKECEAIKAVQQIYSNAKTEKEAREIIDMLKQNCG